MTETGQHMKKAIVLRTVLAIIAMAGLFLIVRARAARTESCKETMDACSKQENGSKMIWENLSEQFFSSF